MTILLSQPLTASSAKPFKSPSHYSLPDLEFEATNILEPPLRLLVLPALTKNGISSRAGQGRAGQGWARQGGASQLASGLCLGPAVPTATGA